MSDSSLELRNVSKSYEGAWALRDVSLRVMPGEFVVLLGPSGAGKSTIFRCLTGLTQPDVGEAFSLGKQVSGVRGKALRAARKSISLIFQQHNLIGRSSVIDNVLTSRLDANPYWRVLARSLHQRDRNLALASLDRVGLLEKAYDRADTLSGGQQQRVAIARALSQQGKVILADEPVASLDPESSRVVLDTLKSISRDSGISVLCSLHQVDLAREFADRLIGMKVGKVVFDGPPEGLSRAEEKIMYASAQSRVTEPA